MKIDHNSYKIKKLIPFRLLSIYAYDTLGTGHNMYAQIEIDVTDLRQSIRAQRKIGINVSFFGFLLYAIAKTIDENKDFNQIRCGKRSYYFNEVDIDTAIELKHEGVLIPRKYIVRNAANKSNEEITQEIEAAKRKWKETGLTGKDDKKALRWIKWVSILPKGLIKLFIRRLSNKPLKIKGSFGTTYVASVSGFANFSGFIIPFFEGRSRPVSFAIGGVTKKPCIINSEIKIREYLSMTISINHDLIDGAPAARFVNRLKQIIEGVK
ncbi:MAG: 2-oxo acid dehydrogenase subunit E2 [Ignavibacteriales bacterium]|nr:2-oxo acid dehydrogenase subunit E2 [Ignavibacteriales bacterium]